MSVTIVKEQGEKLGLTISGDVENGIFVKHVREDGAAAKSGVKAGSKILSCNAKSFILASKEDALEILKAAGKTVKLVVEEPEEDREIEPEISSKKRRRTVQNGAESDEIQNLKDELAAAKKEIAELKSLMKKVVGLMEKRL
jgi:C-terminal processing protease CtpA/Prc